MAELQGEQGGLSLPRPLPSPPAKWPEVLRFSEGPLHSRRARDRNRQPLAGALARPRLGHLLRGAYDPRGGTLYRRPFLRSSRSYTQRTGATGQRHLGERARHSKAPDRRNSSGLWRRIRAMGSVICVALAHIGEGNPFDRTRSVVPLSGHGQVEGVVLPEHGAEHQRRCRSSRRSSPTVLPHRGLLAQPKTPMVRCPQSVTYC